MKYKTTFALVLPALLLTSCAQPVSLSKEEARQRVEEIVSSQEEANNNLRKFTYTIKEVEKEANEVEETTTTLVVDLDQEYVRKTRVDKDDDDNVVQDQTFFVKDGFFYETNSINDKTRNKTNSFYKVTSLDEHYYDIKLIFDHFKVDQNYLFGKEALNIVTSLFEENVVPDLEKYKVTSKGEGHIFIEWTTHKTSKFEKEEHYVSTHRLEVENNLMKSYDIEVSEYELNSKGNKVDEEFVNIYMTLKRTAEVVYPDLTKFTKTN